MPAETWCKICVTKSYYLSQSVFSKQVWQQRHLYVALLQMTHPPSASTISHKHFSWSRLLVFPAGLCGGLQTMLQSKCISFGISQFPSCLPYPPQGRWRSKLFHKHHVGVKSGMCAPSCSSLFVPFLPHWSMLYILSPGGAHWGSHVPIMGERKNHFT